ncbi:hypothetical protein B0A48_14505 [Cryoendolithus antarcticus]|uniref:Uncharacterized protein n=1 Tax=Cryoendolithus antarcticus TaxID=1507870 RepID=A0A1V8SKP4_9PEZI|nr:hypothetical protein B0A48_14505 [Cryoendolithus antarcticus]
MPPSSNSQKRRSTGRLPPMPLSLTNPVRTDETFSPSADRRPTPFPRGRPTSQAAMQSPSDSQRALATNCMPSPPTTQSAAATGLMAPPPTPQPRHSTGRLPPLPAHLTYSRSSDSKLSPSATRRSTPFPRSLARIRTPTPFPARGPGSLIRTEKLSEPSEVFPIPSGWTSAPPPGKISTPDHELNVGYGGKKVAAMLKDRQKTPGDVVSRITTFATEGGVVAVDVSVRSVGCKAGHEPMATEGNGIEVAVAAAKCGKLDGEGEVDDQSAKAEDAVMTETTPTSIGLTSDDGLIGPPPPEAFAAYANKTFAGLDMMGKILASMYCSKGHSACLELIRKDGCSSIVFISARSGSNILREDGSCKMDVVEALEGLKNVAERP